MALSLKQQAEQIGAGYIQILGISLALSYGSVIMLPG